MIRSAEEADRTADHYVNAPQTLKTAFEESISDGKEQLKASQDIIDSRTEFYLTDITVSDSERQISQN